MSYSKGANLPGQSASKLGHLAVIQSDWVRSLVSAFDQVEQEREDPSKTLWRTFDNAGATPLRNVWAVDGSFVTIKSEQKPPREMAFVKTALLAVDRVRLNAIDRENPHPLLLQDVLTGSAVFHATVFPLNNVRTPLGSNYDAVRHIVRDSMKIDEGGVFYETLKWLAYRKWDKTANSPSPSFFCPHCHTDMAQGLAHDTDEGICPSCTKIVFLTDMIGFHLDMDEDSAPDSVASAYMLVMEHLMLFTAIRVLWGHTDRSLASETLFIKDGPLTLRSQYSKLVPNIRSFLQHARDVGRPVHVVGQEKSGAFFDHLSSIAHFAPPHDHGQTASYAVLSHEFVRREVHRSPDLQNPYGSRTNWGEKVYFKLDPGTYMVLNMPTGNYLSDEKMPTDNEIIGLNRILATLPDLISHKFTGALFPIELADGIASMSSYPSAKILERFINEQAL